MKALFLLTNLWQILWNWFMSHQVLFLNIVDQVFLKNAGNRCEEQEKQGHL